MILRIKPFDQLCGGVGAGQDRRMPRALRRPSAPRGRLLAASVSAAAAMVVAVAPVAVAHKPKPPPYPGSCKASHKADPDRCASIAEIHARARWGVQVPAGAIDPAAVSQGRPAEVHVRLGPDPLGIAATLGVAPAAFWGGAHATLTATGPGFTARAGIQADGTALLAFTPPEPGSVRMSMSVPGKSLLAPLGLGHVRGWGVSSPVVYAGQPPDSPVLEVEGRPVSPPDPGPEPAPIPGPEPAP
jgi:hypothetical protein